MKQRKTRRMRVLESQRRQSRKSRAQLSVEALEDRSLLSVAPFDHVLILSVDGLHQADVADPALQQDLSNLIQLEQNGVTYTKAFTTSPSDSFPGTLSYLTGAGPGTTGVFYDASYSRELFAPGSNLATTPPGTPVTFDESIDKNSTLLSGGGNFDASSIDPTTLPIDSQGNVVYPHQFLKVNTIFDVAHNAGLYTAFSDKHPAYDIANGPSGNGINDLYTPEINSNVALFDPSTGQTVNADALLTLTSQLTVAPGYNVTTFATSPPGTSQPDSIAVDGSNVYVGYGNGVAKDGSDGKSSTIVQYNTEGAVVQTFSVLGHNDGLKVDPSTHLLWALQNEDGNPNLVVIDPVAGTLTNYTIAAVNGGGYDDITFLAGNVYLSASNPSLNPNSDPAVVQVTLSGTTASVTPVLLGNATAIDALTNQPVTLNLQDPDSMTADPSGNLVLTSQSDNELVIISNPGTSNQAVTLLPLSDAANNPVSVDDTLYPPSSSGAILMTDKSGVIYQITGPAVHSGLVLSAAQDIGQLGSLDAATGIFTPVISGLGSPRGLAFLQHADPFAGLDKFTLVDASTDPIDVDPSTHLSNDPNLELTTHNDLLTQRYDDLKVQAILNEIAGLPSHQLAPGSPPPQVPALFAMNFQAVSVAQKAQQGGIDVQSGQEIPSVILNSALSHTDASIGKIVDALKSQGLWDSTLVVVTAKHGQNPRLNSAILIGNVPDPTNPSNTVDEFTAALESQPTPILVAQSTTDDVALIWLKDQSQTAAAAQVLQNLEASHPEINQVLWGKDLVKADLGNALKNDRTPDIIVTLNPGYVLANPASKFKRAEHGGFSPDDTHIALLVSSGGLASDVKGTIVTDTVQTKQIAVTALEALGLDPKKLQGAVAEKTEELPGLDLQDLTKRKEQEKERLQNIDHFIIIYQENWSFDGLYGSFPGANGLANALAWNALYPQIDRATDIRANNGDAILIAGTTKYGDDAEALQALENEWAQPNESVATHVANLEAGVTSAEQVFKLDVTTVFANGHHNRLAGGSGMNWYLASLGTDHLDDVFGEDVITSMHK